MKVILFLLLVHVAFGVDFYVSPSGSDLNAGGVDTPFLTIARAKEAVAYELPTATEDITVWIREGVYRLTAPLEFTSSDSGSADISVTYSGYEGEVVEVCGAIEISPTWEVHAGEIMVANIGAGLDLDSVFINSDQQVMARYPNYDENEDVLNGYAGDILSNERRLSWSNPENGYVRALHNGQWGGQSYKIVNFTGAGVFDLEWVGDNNRGSAMHHTYRMVENIFEELDAPKEWYYDTNSGHLYVYPEEGVDLDSSQVEVAVTEELIKVVGTEDDKVQNLAFQNIQFTKTHRTLFSREYERPLRSDWGVARAGAIFLENCDDITLSGNVFSYLGGNAVFLSGYNKGHLITDNEFYEVGATCVNIVGQISAVRYPSFWDNEDHKVDILDLEPGPQSEDYPRELTVSHNYMTRFGRVEKQVAGVNISMSESINVSYNTIHDCPRAGINICDGTWGGHIIEYNDVFDCVKETYDHGPFNAWGRDRYWSYLGFDSRGNLGTEKEPYAFLDAWKTTHVRYNRFHYDEPRHFGIDLDDGASNYEVYGNLCLNTGIKLRDGFGRKAYNNVIISGRFDCHVWFDNCRDEIYNNIVVNDRVYTFALINDSNIAGKSAYIDNNVFYNHGGGVTVTSQTWPSVDHDSNSVTADPQFINPQGNDYTVSDSSPVLAFGYENIPTSFGRAGAPEPSPVEYATISSESPLNPEPLMGAVVGLVYDISIQSALGARDTDGVYFSSVPSGSYAEAQGFQTLDLILEIGGVDVTDPQSFWVEYHKIPAGETVEVVLLRDQSEMDHTFTKLEPDEELNNQSSGVVYTGSWTEEADDQAYYSDLAVTNTQGDSAEITFYGTGVTFYAVAGSDAGELNVYLDGVLQDVVSLYAAATNYNSVAYEIQGLDLAEYTLTIENNANAALRLDSFAIEYDTTPKIAVADLSVTTNQMSVEPTVSNDDLGQSEWATVSAAGLFSGSTVDEVMLSTGDTIEIAFDLENSPGGYDISSLESTFSWGIHGGGRSNQGYGITFTLIDDSLVKIVNTHWLPNDPASMWTTVGLERASGRPIAQNVKSMSIEISEDANAGGVVVAREFDIIGSASKNYKAWLEGYPDLIDSELNGNSDADSYPNILEYALGLDPLEKNAGAISMTKQEGVCKLHYPRRANSRDEVEFSIEYSSNLIDWFILEVEEELSDENSEVQSVSVILPEEVPDSSMMYARIIVAE